MSTATDTPTHRGFRLTILDDPDPIMLEPELVDFLVRLHLPKTIHETSPLGDGTSDEDASSEPSTVEFGTIEWDDDEPDYQFGQLTLTAAQTASILASSVADVVRQAVAYERTHGVLADEAESTSEPTV